MLLIFNANADPQMHLEETVFQTIEKPCSVLKGLLTPYAEIAAVFAEGKEVRKENLVLLPSSLVWC
jgi:hypothetical protein